MCWCPFIPVDQPFSALPPSFGHEWQSSINKRSALIMLNIHQITRQRIQSADFAHKQSFIKRISSMLKTAWGV